MKRVHRILLIFTALYGLILLVMASKDYPLWTLTLTGLIAFPLMYWYADRSTKWSDYPSEKHKQMRSKYLFQTFVVACVLPPVAALVGAFL